MQVTQIDSVGIELEVENIEVSPPRALGNIFTTTVDRSCESDAIKTAETDLVLRNLGKISFPHKSIVLGGEYVSQILDTSDDSFFTPIKELTNYLDSAGESWMGNRASIHVHVCFQNPNLRMLKNSLRLWKFLEDFFYLIGGMGYTFRGKENNSCYCRPLTKNGPVVVPTKNGVSQCINLDHLLASRTLIEFWYKWGDLPDQLEDEKKYYPVRYLGFNLGSAYRRGTLEFRVFNKTINPLYILAIINLCKKFSGMAMGEIISLDEENSVYSGRNKDEIAKTFLTFAKMSELDLQSVKEIMKIIGRSELISFPKDEYIYSHLEKKGKVHTHWRNFDYSPENLSNKVEIIHPNFVDLHILRGE